MSVHISKMQMIARFHERFEIAYYGGPRALDKEQSQFRINFMSEELNEYIDAVVKGNMELQLDSLVDLVYVALGTAYLQGFDFNEAFRRVHLANMEKRLAVTADKSKRGYHNDVVKPEGWKPANLEDLTHE